MKKNGELRGCIGEFNPDVEVYKCVLRLGSSAAKDDSRFPPVDPEELKDIQIGITLFPENPLIKVNNVKEIEIGKHGLYIRKGLNRGTLLPQVAVEHNWNVLTFLQQTCRKAGLDRDEWMDPRTEIYMYSAEIFGED